MNKYLQKYLPSYYFLFSFVEINLQKNVVSSRTLTQIVTNQKLLHEKLLVDLDWPESKHIHVPSINVFAKTGMGLELWPVELSNEKLPIPLTESKTLASQY